MCKNESAMSCGSVVWALPVLRAFEIHGIGMTFAYKTGLV